MLVFSEYIQFKKKISFDIVPFLATKNQQRVTKSGKALYTQKNHCIFQIFKSFTFLIYGVCKNQEFLTKRIRKTGENQDI